MSRLPHQLSRVAILAFLFLTSIARAAEPATKPARTMDLLVMDAASGEPLEKVKVRVNNDGDDKSLYTGADGHVTILLPKSPNAYFGATASLKGYVNRSLRWQPNENDSIPD